MGRQVYRFAVVGALSTVVHLGLFAVLAGAGVAAQAANLVALALATAANTAANRRWTFGVRGVDGAARHQLQGYVLFALTWLLTAAGLWLVDRFAPGAGTAARTVALAVMTGAAAAVRFVAMRTWMFRASGGRAALPGPPRSGYPVRARSRATGRGGVA